MPKTIKGIGNIYNIKEMAEQLGASEVTVMRHYRAGKLRGRKVGKNVLFTQGSLSEFLENKDGDRTKRKNKPKPKQAATRKPAPANKPLFNDIDQEKKADQKAQQEIPTLEGAPTEDELTAQGEKAELIDALKKAGGHREDAGKILGIRRQSVAARMKKHGINFPSSRSKK